MAEPKLSEVEYIKANSDYLRGTLAKSLENPLTGALFPEDTHLIKFHGAYQQTDRDLDSERKAQKLEPLYSLMIRIRVPGGVASPAQWLRMDALADQYGNGTLKLTTRQAFQLHGIRKRHLKATIQGFNEVFLDSLAGCGDVNRNVMCSPNPNESRVHEAVYQVSKAISDAFTPRTTAYYEVFMDGKPVDESQPFQTQKGASGADEEPVYGKTYLPRKFKIALAVPPFNDTDIFANDIGLIAIEQNGELLGFNVAAGGGLGMTFGMPETFPRLADMLGFVPVNEVLNVCEAIITTQRDHGNRENRKFSRLKYTVERMGLDTFKAEVERRAGISFTEPLPYRFTHSGDPLGWVKTHDGHFNLGLFIEGGRILDKPGFPLKTTLKTLALVHDGDFRLTGNQNLVIGNISPQKRPIVEAILDKYGILEATHKQTALRQNSIACVAMNTCTLAFAEAERYLPTLIDKIDTIVRAYRLDQTAINIRMTGCPNGCGRPYLGEIAFIGRSPGYYNMYLGAAHNGERLNKLYKEMLDEAGILREIEPVLADFARNRQHAETFGDFVIRQGYVKATTHGTNFHD
ncbi:MAG: NADPH-dependent assimilatory sulfite reductase hemoprotein subunit [Chitinophagales bacterium]|nr:NADPH-dependent assimilatory sulfite reductase hemoprotein subunit [Chitinophagales bacterium]